ncbi:hypothetical protein PILCRDRAFT_823495 [Piloderma croceum F 1598]|uniref:Uncharacterized protein n=1 Tax=Piloderma croceum (strain F 1598) TaxID=765440 RepID=A0A0C3F3B4_PILCF|nr:hypothetical protein PILCRDRAFT_823495 [Piloderma croceum F 1598]
MSSCIAICWSSRRLQPTLVYSGVPRPVTVNNGEALFARRHTANFSKMLVTSAVCLGKQGSPLLKPQPPVYNSDETL